MQRQEESRSSDQPYASPAFLIHLGTPPVNSSSALLMCSQLSPAPRVGGNVQVVTMSTRWQFSPQQRWDTRGSSAQPSAALILPLGAAHGSRADHKHRGVLGFTQGYRNTSEYKQRVLLKFVGTQTKVFIEVHL